MLSPFEELEVGVLSAEGDFCLPPFDFPLFCLKDLTKAAYSFDKWS